MRVTGLVLLCVGVSTLVACKAEDKVRKSASASTSAAANPAPPQAEPVATPPAPVVEPPKPTPPAELPGDGWVFGTYINRGGKQVWGMFGYKPCSTEVKVFRGTGEVKASQFQSVPLKTKGYCGFRANVPGEGEATVKFESKQGKVSEQRIFDPATWEAPLDAAAVDEKFPGAKACTKILSDAKRGVAKVAFAQADLAHQKLLGRKYQQAMVHGCSALLAMSQMKGDELVSRNAFGKPVLVNDALWALQLDLGQAAEWIDYELAMPFLTNARDAITRSNEFSSEKERTKMLRQIAARIDAVQKNQFAGNRYRVF